jgi:hypothetical protein
MPKKRATKKKQSQKVKGGRNNVNQNNINIKIGARSKKSAPTNPKPSQSTGSNIVVHVAAPTPQLQHIHPGFYENKPVAIPLGVAAPKSNPFVNQTVDESTQFAPSKSSTGTQHDGSDGEVTPFNSPVQSRFQSSNDNPFGVQMSPKDSFADFYGSPHKMYKTNFEDLVPFGQLAKNKKRLSFNDDVDEIKEYDATPSPMIPEPQGTTVYTHNMFDATQTPAKAPLDDVDAVTQGFHLEYNKNPNIADMEEVATPQPMRNFATPDEATRNNLAAALKLSVEDIEDLPDLEDVPNDIEPDEIAPPQLPVQEQMISNPEEDEANRPRAPLDPASSEEALNRDLFNPNVARDTMLPKYNVDTWLNIADYFGIKYDDLPDPKKKGNGGPAKEAIYNRIMALEK